MSRAPTLAAQIRAWLDTQPPVVVDGVKVPGRFAAEIRAQFPDKTRNAVAGAIGDMVRAGLLVSDGGTPARYAVGRGMLLQHYASDEEAKAAYLARRAKTHRARRANESQEERDLRLAKQREYALTARRKRGCKPRPAPVPAIDRAIATVRRMKGARPEAQQPTVRKFRPELMPDVAVIAAPDAPRKTSADFVAEGGVIQRLRDGEVSKHNRLHRIGAHA